MVIEKEMLEKNTDNELEIKKDVLLSLIHANYFEKNFDNGYELILNAFETLKNINEVLQNRINEKSLNFNETKYYGKR